MESAHVLRTGIPIGMRGGGLRGMGWRPKGYATEALGVLGERYKSLAMRIYILGGEVLDLV